MVSAVHEENNNLIQQERKKTQSNKVNKKCVKEYWKEDNIKTIAISQIITYYNHWMVGTDLAD